jgi:hypothetical protein
MRRIYASGGVGEYDRCGVVTRSSGLPIRTMHGNVADMFNRHRNDPDPTSPPVAAVLRRRLAATAPISRSAVVIDRRPVRRRLVGSASIGLRHRLGQPVLALPRT